MNLLQKQNNTQLILEDAVIEYQRASELRDKNEIDYAYKKIVSLYNPLDFYASWYDQYKYLFDSQEDFISDYQKVFITVLLGWKPRNKRNKSRYEGSGEFKNYFIGSLYHNYINMIKSDQAAKRNVTKMCPLCSEWVNPISTHLLSEHTHILWDFLSDMSIDIESLNSCPFCSNFKISKTLEKNKIPDLLRSHFVSKHSSLLFNKFNEMHPEISTIAPKVISSCIEENNDELDIYEITEEKGGLMEKLSYLNLDDVQKKVIENILNGETDLKYKNQKCHCSKDEWENAIEQLKEIITVYGTEY